MGITFFKKFKKENLDINRITLDKKSIYSSTTVKLSSKLVTETSLYSKEELEEQIKRFLVTMIENFPTFPIERFKENFIDLNINNLALTDNKSFYKHDLKNKSINFLDKDALFHEFLHFASDKIYTGKAMCGFEYSNEKYRKVGRGLNEGYTQLLCSRYFPTFESMICGLYMTHISEKVEEIFGREKMGDLYFNGNLFDIINELTKLSSEEEAKQFIFDLDKLYDTYMLAAKTDTFDKNIELMDKLLNKLRKYMDKCMIAKNNNKKSVM